MGRLEGYYWMDVKTGEVRDGAVVSIDDWYREIGKDWTWRLVRVSRRVYERLKDKKCDE